MNLQLRSQNVFLQKLICLVSGRKKTFFFLNKKCLLLTEISSPRTVVEIYANQSLVHILKRHFFAEIPSSSLPDMYFCKRYEPCVCLN